MLVPEASKALHGRAEQAVEMEQAGPSQSWEMGMAVGIPVFSSLVPLEMVGECAKPGAVSQGHLPIGGVIVEYRVASPCFFPFPSTDGLRK